jgi:DNA-binding CsgD family transcriptional regulator
VGRVVDLVAAALTTREREVAELLLDAKGNVAIALSLGISERAVKHSLRGMCRKAGLRDPNRILLARVLLGIPRLKKNRLRFRRAFLLGFREPHRPVGASPRARKSQPVGAGCARIASRPAPGGAVG